ncbi:hypothetical protein [Candidatus Allofournierella excrementavium]|uniref:hypothetical protein n=1 Tax=Candidatus Allofournierella excrementavium TaxID=2838591 RepID=UPI003AB47B06
MKSYPYTSEVTYDSRKLPLYDRAVDSAFLRKVFAQYFSDGVFYKPENALQVVADTGMQVKVQPGACHIQGAMGIEEDIRTLQVQAAETQDRIDTVVARHDLSRAMRKIDLYVLKGLAAESPQPPTLTRDGTTWEIGLANLFISKNTTNIPQERITDTRMDTSRCGQVMTPLQTPDWAPYFAQLQAVIAAQADAGSSQMEEWQAAFEAWFEHMKEQLSEDAAGHLQVQVDDAAAAAQAATSRTYTAVLPVSGWAGSASAGYTQTVSCEGMTADVVTLPPAIQPTGVRGTDIAQREALGYISMVETLEGQVTVTCWEDKPTVDLTVYLVEAR